MQHRPNILVTGASGFIGRKLVDCLLEDEGSVRILSRGEKHLAEDWTGKVEIWAGDMTERATLSGIADSIDTVYHLAGEIRNARLCDAVNRVGTESLLAVCQSAGVRRFLYLSSVGVMGFSGAAERLDETTGARPRGAYEISKYAAECSALKYHQDCGMQVTVVRPSIVFGEGRNPESDSFLPLVRAVNAGRFCLLGRDYLSSYIYVGDVVAACLMVAEHCQTGGQVYIVNEPISLMPFVNEMARLLGVPRLPVLPDAVGVGFARLLRLIRRFGSLYNRTVFSMDKLSDLGFELSFGYREGLRRTIAWYRKAGVLPSKPHLVRQREI